MGQGALETSAAKQMALVKDEAELETGKFVHYVGKGWHVSVILGFLRDFMENLNVDSDLKMLVWSGDELMSFLHAERQNRGLLLTEAGIHQVTVLGDFHLKMLLVASQKHTGITHLQVIQRQTEVPWHVPYFGLCINWTQSGHSIMLDGRGLGTQSCESSEAYPRKENKTEYPSAVFCRSGI